MISLIFLLFCSQARAAYGPLYKQNIVWNIVNYLKREYLTVKEKRLPLPQLLKNTFGEEVQISEVIKKVPAFFYFYENNFN